MGIVSKFKPEHKDYFLDNYNQFISDLDELDQKLENNFKAIKVKLYLFFIRLLVI